jgi:peroxiredoxin
VIRRAVRSGGLCALMLAVLAVGCSKGASAPEPAAADGGARVSKGTGPAIGYTAPDFELKDVYGHPERLSDHRGQVVLLNFWATWCGPCRVEMPTIQALHEDYADRDFTVLSVAGDFEGASKVGPFMEEVGVTFPGLIDASGTVQDAYFVNALPMTFLLDRNGVVAYKLVGFFDWNLPKFRGLVEELLNEPV